MIAAMIPMRSAAVALALAASAAPAPAQDALTRIIVEQFRIHEGKTLCSPPSATPETLSAAVFEQLKRSGSKQSVTGRDVAVAAWTRFPCPFSPFRPELRPATSQDIEGVWLFAEGSQKLRFPPRSDRQPPTGLADVKCDAVGYYPGGELRHAIVGGKIECPFHKAADMDVARKNPRVSSWSMLRDGRVGVARTDVANHVEEWDLYVVVSPFEASGVQMQAGDLVAYVRRENGNEVNAATQFRHLRRLP
jgi:hypothetical protein